MCEISDRLNIQDNDENIEDIPDSQAGPSDGWDSILEQPVTTDEETTTQSGGNSEGQGISKQVCIVVLLSELLSQFKNKM